MMNINLKSLPIGLLFIIAFSGGFGAVFLPGFMAVTILQVSAPIPEPIPLPKALQAPAPLVSSRSPVPPVVSPEVAFTPGVEGRSPDEVCNSTSQACQKWTEMARKCEENMAARESGYMGKFEANYCSDMESFREKVTGIDNSSSPGAYSF
jgi:hypothetical protein